MYAILPFYVIKTSQLTSCLQPHRPLPHKQNMKLVFVSSLVSAALAWPASWGYETQPWQMGYCEPTEYARQSPIDIANTGVVKTTTPDTLIDAGTFTRAHLKEPTYAVRVNDIEIASAHSITFSFDQKVGDEKFSCPQFHCPFADSEHCNEICEDYNPFSGNQKFERCGSGRCITTIEKCYGFESNSLICPCVPGFTFNTTETKCISEESCQATVNMILNVTKPCCESESLPTERPLVGLIVFTQNITNTVESPFCESEYLPSTRQPVTGPITYQFL